jgi:hypothetical protein
MNINEDLRKWVAEKWVDIGAPKKGGGYKPCGRQKGEKRKGYPKCVPLAKARSMSKGQRRSAVKRKRAAGNAGPTPTNVSTFSRKNESMNTYDRVYSLLLEKVMPDTYKKMRAARKAMGKKAAELFAKSNKPTAPGEERSLAGAAIKAVRAGKTAKKKEKFAHDVEKYKRKETVDDSIEHIGDLITEVAAWQRKEGKNPSGGLNKKGVESYRRENPGSKLKTAVTTKPSKLKKGSKAASRRKSFCARMGGMKKRRTSAKTANDPNSRINKALRKWNC